MVTKKKKATHKKKTVPKKHKKQKNDNLQIYSLIVLGIAILAVLGFILLRPSNVLASADMLEITIGETIDVQATGETFTITTQDIEEINLFYSLEGHEASEEELIEQVAIRKVLLENSRSYTVSEEVLAEEEAYMQQIIDSIPDDLPELQEIGISKQELLARAQKRLQDDILIQNYLNEEILPLIPMEEAVEASHILICFEGKQFCESNKTQAEARTLLEEIRGQANSETFANLANIYSDDAGTPDGYLGFFTRGMMVPEFEKAAFSMDVGTISEIIETDFGYHILYLQDTDTIPNEQFAMQIQSELFYAIQEKINIRI